MDITIKTLREYLDNIPRELDDYIVVFSEVGNYSDDNKRWVRKNSSIQAVGIDTAAEELSLMTKNTYNTIEELSN